MPTKQLFGRLHSLQQCEESATLSDGTPEEAAVGEGILFKNTAEWQTAYAELKAVVTTREHMPSAAERSKTRQQRATKNSNKRAGGALLRRAGRLRPAAPIMNVRKPYELPGTRSKKSSPDSRRYSRCAGVLRAATFARHPPAPATRFCRMAHPRRCGCADSPSSGSVVRFHAHGAARARYILSEIFSPAHPLCHGFCCGCLRCALWDRLFRVASHS